MSRFFLFCVSARALRRLYAVLLLFLPVLVVIRDDDQQVKKLVAVYEQFREAVLKDDEAGARRWVAGYSAVTRNIGVCPLFCSLGFDCCWSLGGV